MDYDSNWIFSKLIIPCIGFECGSVHIVLSVVSCHNIGDLFFWLLLCWVIFICANTIVSIGSGWGIVNIRT